jgi:hypothetical protein
MDRAELETGIGQGLSIAQLATRFGCSKGSIRYWLKKYGLRTRNPPKRASSPESIGAREAGLRKLVQDCAVHGPQLFVLETGGYYRCTRCRADRVTARRRRLKQILIAEAGGRCSVCGYSRTPRALEFHHLDPSTKDFAVSSQGRTRSLASLRAEARKCVLLCSNCHAEAEDGLLTVPIHYGDRSAAAQSAAIGCLGE